MDGIGRAWLTSIYTDVHGKRRKEGELFRPMNDYNVGEKRGNGR